MAQYQNVNVNLSNSQFDKLKSATKIETGVTKIVCKYDYHQT